MNDIIKPLGSVAETKRFLIESAVNFGNKDLKLDFQTNEGCISLTRISKVMVGTVILVGETSDGKIASITIDEGPDGLPLNSINYIE